MAKKKEYQHLKHLVTWKSCYLKNISYKHWTVSKKAPWNHAVATFNKFTVRSSSWINVRPHGCISGWHSPTAAVRCQQHQAASNHVHGNEQAQPQGETGGAKTLVWEGTDSMTKVGSKKCKTKLSSNIFYFESFVIYVTLDTIPAGWLQYKGHISRRHQEVHAALTTIAGVVYVETGDFVATLVPSKIWEQQPNVLNLESAWLLWTNFLLESKLGTCVSNSCQRQQTLQRIDTVHQLDLEGMGTNRSKGPECEKRSLWQFTT